MSYLEGQTIRISGRFRNAAGDPVDPATVVFGIRALNAEPTVYVYDTDDELVRDSDGDYHVDVDREAGRHIYRWEGDTPDAAFEKVIDVRRKRVEI